MADEKAWCLPTSLVSKFRSALKSGALDPTDLSVMSSAERRKAFSDIVGENHAEPMNVLFEQKLLQKNRQKAMVAWAKSVQGITRETRDDMVQRIQSMEDVLTPSSEREFLADLAKQKLGFNISAAEANTLFDASSKVEKARDLMLKTNDYGDRINYGRAILDLQDTIDSMKPNHQSWLDRVVSVLAVPKSALTSVLHFSAPFVQGVGMIGTKQWYQGFGQMFRYFASESNYRDLQAYIVSHPDYKIARKAGLGLTEVTDRLSKREEAIQSSLLEHVPGLGIAVRASSRAFTGYLNYVRFNRYTELLNAARLVGEDVRVGSKAAEDIAKAVNDFTGRGNLGLNDSLGYGHSMQLANALLFSPRKLSATVNMFNPVRYLNPSTSKTARMAATRQMAGMIIGTGAMLGLAASMGAKVDMDPRSQKFAKIQIGDTEFDTTGGNGIYLRLLGRLVTGSEITSNGKEVELNDESQYKPTTRADLVGSFLRGKLSPIASLMYDAMYGSDPVGRPFSVSQEIRDKLVPITLGSWINFAQSDPENSAAYLPALAAAIGVEMRSDLPSEFHQYNKLDPINSDGVNTWGETSSVYHPTPKNNIDKEAHKLGMTIRLPPKTISGVKLSDKQYVDYITQSGQFTKRILEPMIASPSWDSQPDSQKANIIRSMVLKGRMFAQETIKAQALGSDNDIYMKSKMKKFGVQQ